jgi:uncharacterized surface protein with fasciclin (FAS1) repeats
MNKKIYKIIKSALLLFICSYVLIQCTKKDEVVAPIEFIDVKLAADPDFSLLQTAIAQAKLESFTKGPGPFTTNAALNAAGVTSATLPTIDSLTLTAFLLNHFQNIKRTSFEFPEGPNAPMASMAGFNNFSAKNKTLNKTYINGATVLESDIACGNGIMHKIDKALIQPSATISILLMNNPNYSLMVQAITKAALTTTFAPAATAPITVFAIDNATMTANGYDATTIPLLTPAQVTVLSNILRYHIVPGRNFTIAMKSGILKTNLGSNVTVNLGTTVSIKGISNAAAFNIAGRDALASNGVIHEIAGMLKP